MRACLRNLILLWLVMAAASNGRAQRLVVGTDATITQGQTGCLGIALESLGDENALSFSLCYDTSLLTFISATRVGDGLSGSLFVNTNRVGSVGFAFALSAGEMFEARSNLLVQVCFRAAAGIPGTNTLVRLCDEPVIRGTVADDAQELATAYSDSTVSIGGVCTYTLLNARSVISASGGQTTVPLVTGPSCSWGVVNTNDWIVFPTSSGTGNQNVPYVVAPNPIATGRTGVVHVAGQAFTVAQVAAPCSFQLSPAGRVHDHLSVNTIFDVITFDNCPWIVINTNDWILIKLYTNGVGTDIVRYTVLPNEDPHARSGNIVVGGQPFLVTQLAAPCSYTLLPTNRVVSPFGVSGQLSVFTANDCDWTVSNTNLWISLSGPAAGKGNAVLDYTVAPRFAPVERTGVITIGGRNVTFTQLASPCSYAIIPTNRSHTSARATNTITVSTNTDEDVCMTLTWTATTTNPWIRILTGSNGIGRGTVRYSVDRHGIGGSRTGYVLVADRLFTINQAGQPCNFARSPSSRSHTYLAETGLVNITAFTGCVWTATASQPWVTINNGSGSGNGSFDYALDINTGPARSATIAIGPVSFSIEQGAAALPSVSTPASASVLVGANVSFSATVSGTAPFTYQWRFNDVDLVDGPEISGATSPRLTLANVQPGQSGNYTLVVGNLRGFTTSGPGVLRVNTAPIISPLPPKVVNRGTLLAFKPTVIDEDIPLQTITYSLLSGPSGASIHSSSGLFTWTPSASQALGTNVATIRVVDNGSPALSATQRVALVVISAPTTNLTLIATGAVWKYNDRGLDLGMEWRERFYDDSSWRSGPAPLGYDAKALRTTVSFGPSSKAKHPTTYFRHAFVVTGIESISGLTARVRRDDGVVLYLNGREVYRNNMPAGMIGYSTFASASGGDSYVATPLDSDALENGVNVLAAEIHQKSRSSSDIAFDLELRGLKTLIAPAIVTHPVSQEQPEGGSAQFSVNASGLLPLSYQWWFNDAPVSGAVSAAFSRSNLVTAHSGAYFVVVTNSSGAVTSSVAHLNVFRVINLPPSLGPISDKSVPEGTLLTFTATATDANVPAQRLFWSLAPGAPPGASIHPDSGQFTWQPNETEGGSTFPVTVRVTDNGHPPASDFTSFFISVVDTNAAPILAPIGNKTVMENTLLTFTATATDSDIPAQNLTFSLSGAPVGASFDPVTGVFTWTPARAQAPSTNIMVIRVTDDGLPPKIDSETITVIATGINTPPVLGRIPDQVVRAGDVVTFTAGAGDTDVPAQTLRFSLASGAPPGASVNAVSGAFRWVTSASDSGASNAITLRVTDNGSPPLSSSQTFTLYVLPGAVTNLILIPIESVWRYRDTGEDLGTAWKEPGYNDSGWRSGPGTLGYGGSYIVTEVSQGSSSSRHITTYFRRSFSVGNPDALSPLRLRVRRDDGVVVYLNGTEVRRDNMPDGPITYQTTAPLNMDGDDELTYFPAPPIPSSLLVPGENVLAVELHQKSQGSSDISFDLELTATVEVLPPTIVAQPEAQSVLEGQAATFAITAFGSMPLRYQWRFNEVPITGATNPVLVLPAVHAAAGGSYSVIVSNAAGSAVSVPASLTVLRLRGVSLTAAEGHGLSGSQVLVPVHVSGFTNVASFQFSLQWDALVATLVGAEQLALPTITFGTAQTNQGVLAASWDHPEGSSTALEGGATLFVLRFLLVGPPGLSTPLMFTNRPVTIEFADHSLAPLPVLLTPGRLAVDIAPGVPAPSSAATFEPLALPIPPPRMGIALVGESVALWWSAHPGVLYRLQASDNSTSWNDLGDIVATGEVVSALDASPLFGQRIYRILVVE